MDGFSLLEPSRSPDKAAVILLAEISAHQPMEEELDL